MKFVLFSMLSAISLISKTESLHTEELFGIIGYYNPIIL